MPHPDSDGSIASLAFAIVNARVWTSDERRPWADAVLVQGDVIVAVGSSAELRKRAGAGASVIDAGGRMVVPLAANGRLASDEPADLAIVDRIADASAATTSSEGDYVFVLEKGRLTVDRLRR
jgi:imidazolonepropionase-like amidohydrolase